MRQRPAFHVTTSHEDNKKSTIVITIILANIFCRTRVDLCGITIEPSNYCAGRSSLIARSHTGKTVEQIVIRCN